MKFLIVQEWINTADNHAGMKYLAMQIKQHYFNEIELFVIPDFYKNKNYKISSSFERFFAFFMTKVNMLKAKFKFYLELRKITKEILNKIAKADDVILMEYMDKIYPTINIPKILKKKQPYIQLTALVHLSPQKLEKMFTYSDFHKWLDPVDKIITLGSSLTKYLISKGILAEKIKTSFHYVDDYYRAKKVNYNVNARINVIAMGNQARNYKLLQQIVKDNPDVDFIICQGVDDIERYFRNSNNVKLIPFVSENTLREYMRSSDISLNPMVDTVGSNVIVTSMAMGLAMVVSDVGSIRDYCDESNAFFCDKNSVESFNRAIKKLIENRVLLQTMKMSSYRISKNFSIENFIFSM